MRYRVVFAPEAVAQIEAIYTYVSERAGPDVALRFTSATIDYCEGFTAFPLRGTLRDDLRPGLRTIGFRKRATIAFFVSSNTVTIVGIFYGGQDVESALNKDAE